MVGYIAQTVVSLVARTLGGARGERVAHDELEHAHWDSELRRWVTHRHPAEVREAA